MDKAGDILVIGGGIIGLSIARRLAKDGAAVTVLDPSPGQGATRAAAGMLAPVAEAHYQEEALLALNLESLALWRGFAAELEEESGQQVGYDESGTLAIAFDPSDRALLEELHRFQEGLGLQSTVLTASASRRLEPALAPGIAGGLDVSSDHQVDPRKVATALLAACQRIGVVFQECRAERLQVDGERLVGVRTDQGRDLVAGGYVLAAGWQSGAIAGLSSRQAIPVRPVKGQVLRLALDERAPRPKRTLRAVVRGNSVYLVPREEGRLVCGATVEEMGEDPRVTAGAVYSLLRDAQAVLPSLSEAELLECVVGFRPGSPDNLPLIGQSGVADLLVATGHYRNGILLAPLTAALIAEELSGNRTTLAAFARTTDPRRFATMAA